jgi:hypothetical protein
MAAPIDLDRPRTLSELLDATFKLWWANRAVFYTLALIIVAPLTMVSYNIPLPAFGSDGEVTATDLRNSFVVLAIALIQTPLVTATHARAVLRMGGGQAVGVGLALREGLAVFGVALGAILVSILGVILGLIVLIIPGIFLAIRWMFVGQAAAIERRGVVAALRSSWRLTAGSWWRVLGIAIVVFLGSAIAGALVQAPFTSIGGAAELAAVALIQAAVYSVSALAMTLFYFDLASRKRAAEAPAAEEASAWE